MAQLTAKALFITTLATLPIDNETLAAQQEASFGQIAPGLKLTGELRGRYEAWNFFEPGPPSVIRPTESEYDFWATRIRLGLKLETDWVDGLVQAEHTGLYDLPSNAFAPAVGPLGLGGAYYRENGGRSKSLSDLHLQQLWLNFKLGFLGAQGLGLKLGRFEVAEGLEYRTQDKKFDFLKTTRVSQRLLGGFGFAHAQRNFDGFSVVYDQPSYNFTATGVRPTQGGFNIDAQDQISKIDTFYTALTGKRGFLLPGTEARLFYLYYNDARNVRVVDNRPVAQRSFANEDSVKLHMIGTHSLTVVPAGPGQIDAMLWGVYQFGDWAEQDHRAWAGTAEVGYQLPQLPLKPWLRGGYFRSSGDKDPNDGRHETFFQVMPTVRLYAKFPYYNQMNIEDIFGQFIVSPLENVQVAIDFHQLALSDKNDLFYAGAGAGSRGGSFGFFGRSGGGQRNLGQLVDISLNHKVNDHVAWNMYYGHAFGGEAIGNAYSRNKNADFGFVEVNLSF
ncbi:MAG: hypothetical protein CVV06_06580 [Gammaproteobacteria bacterium HGW-Gammaproteobacteria-10]|nr:MAG: hypothetical protein CVV06_06580 [Gammaproteobacteria bacterium HGW-Gammaproteobacteria-10]